MDRDVSERLLVGTVPFLASLAPTDLETLATMVTAMTFKDGEVIIQQDEVGDAMFILQEGGSAVYLKQNPRGNAVNRYVLDAVCCAYTCRRLIDLSLIAGTHRASTTARWL